MQFWKKPVVIEATQWFKHGDHPGDHAPFVGSTEQDRQRAVEAPSVEVAVGAARGATCSRWFHRHEVQTSTV